MHGQKKNAKSNGLGLGYWWRWTRYEVREGYVRPAPGAKLSAYDPWELWRDTRPVGRRAYQGNDRQRTPYSSLLDMLSELEYEKGVDADFKPGEFDMLVGPLSAVSEKKIAAWCQQYGLLGVLPHRTLQATLAAFAADGVQTQYTRMGVGWMATERQRDNPFTPILSPHTVMRSLRGTGIAAESLLVNWARFFPDVAPDQRVTYHYPEPLTEEFWKLYAEPIQDFLSAAHVLREALTAIGMEYSPHRRIRALHRAFTGGLLPTLDGLLAPMGLGVQVERAGHLRLHWVGTSLLSSLTTMLLEDLAEGSALQCPCGRLFVSNAYQARYHSTACRWRFEKRKQRNKSQARHPHPKNKVG